MMDFNPKVSIVIPVYNGSNYLREAIDSALAQTYRNIEVIVVNDGSNDGGKTEEIIKSYGNKIRYFCKENGGVASALNLGIREMTGEYFSWLSHDDVYYPYKIDEQINFLRKNNSNTDQVILFSDFEYINEKGEFIQKIEITYYDKNRFFLLFLTRHFIHGCTLLIPKKCFSVVGYFKEELRLTQDYDLWFRFAYEYKFEHINKVLIKSRYHSEQCSNLFSDHHHIEIDKLYLNSIKKIPLFSIQQFGSNSLSLVYMKLALCFKIRGFQETSKYAYQQARKYVVLSNPLIWFYFIYFYVLLIVVDGIFISNFKRKKIYNYLKKIKWIKKFVKKLLNIN